MPSIDALSVGLTLNSLFKNYAKSEEYFLSISKFFISPLNNFISCSYLILESYLYWAR